MQYKRSPQKFFQIVYLSLKLYIQNSLLESAASCAFGFVFSFIPILMLIWSFMLGLLKANHNMLVAIEGFLTPYKDFFDIEVVLKYILHAPSLTLSNILLLCFILWMSKKFFSAIIAGFMRIFKTVLKPRTLLNQLLSFAGAFLIVTLSSFVFLLTFALRQFLSSSIFQMLKLNMLSGVLVYIALYLILLLGCTFMFRVYSGTKPLLRLCFFCSTLSCIGFWGFGVFVQLFFNLMNYNIVYGVLSNLILLIFEVYAFFVIFEYFAQFIYVCQFFDVHFLEQLYVLEKNSSQSLWNRMLKFLFYHGIENYAPQDTIYTEQGNYIYKKQEDCSFVYFLIRGQVEEGLFESGDKRNVIHKENTFFGERQCILKEKRLSYAKALTPCCIKKIQRNDFLAMIENNPHIAFEVLK